MIGVLGVAARAFAAVAKANASVLLITQGLPPPPKLDSLHTPSKPLRCLLYCSGSSEQSISFAVAEGCSGAVVASLEEAFSQELAVGDIDGISLSPDEGQDQDQGEGEGEGEGQKRPCL